MDDESAPASYLVPWTLVEPLLYLCFPSLPNSQLRKVWARTNLPGPRRLPGYYGLGMFKSKAASSAQVFSREVFWGAYHSGPITFHLPYITHLEKSVLWLWSLSGGLAIRLGCASAPATFL